jgi:hypothetical protein
MMTVSNILASFVREANRKVKKERENRGNKYEYGVNVNHATGVFKDRLIRVVIEEGRGRRVRLMKELVREIKRRAVPIRLEREVGRKEKPREARFHHNHKSIKLLRKGNPYFVDSGRLPPSVCWKKRGRGSGGLGENAKI